MPFLTERPLSPREFLDECLAFKKARPIESRFLATFLAGELTPAQLRLWAKDMYHYIQPAIPALTAWLAQAPTLVERESARLIGRNLELDTEPEGAEPLLEGRAAEVAEDGGGADRRGEW